MFMNSSGGLGLGGNNFIWILLLLMLMQGGGGNDGYGMPGGGGGFGMPGCNNGCGGTGIGSILGGLFENPMILILLAMMLFGMGGNSSCGGRPYGMCETN